MGDITNTTLSKVNNMFKIEFVQNKKVVQREKTWSHIQAIRIAQTGGYDEFVHYDCVNVYKQAGMEKRLIHKLSHEWESSCQ